MELIPFARIKSAVADVIALQEAIVKFLRQLEVCPLLTGRQINDIAVSASWNKVYHDLGRKPLGGWLVRSNHGVASIPFFYQGAGSSGAYDATDEYLYVYCPSPHANGRVAIWIY